MGKIIKRILYCLIIAVMVWTAALILDRKTLREDVIRFHVVANSDSEEDQTIKLQVRDAVLRSIRKDLEQLSDVNEAKAYIRENLPKIRNTAERAMESAGIDGHVAVSLCREAFEVRSYDTFTLPAGVYESLRIVIGEGQGRNWWCVAFPSLCVPTTQEAFKDAAAGAGFSGSLSHTLSGDDGYELRFFLLDKLGQLENIFFEG